MPLQTLQIEDADPAVLKFHETHPPKFLERAVHMDCGQSQALSEFDLGQWKFVAVVLGAVSKREADVQLAEQVRHAANRGAPAERQRPFTVDCRIEVGAEPVDTREVRETAR